MILKINIKMTLNKKRIKLESKSNQNQMIFKIILKVVTLLRIILLLMCESNMIYHN